MTTIVERLKSNPNDRRLVVTAWNPSQLDQMALPACHLVFVLTHIAGTLSLHWTQRSCDLMLGVPFNIASYGLLLKLLCSHAGMRPGNLSGMLCDCHIYENQIDAAKEQLTRKPRELPTLNLVRISSDPLDIFKWTHDQVYIEEYNPHPKLDFGKVAV